MANSDTNKQKSLNQYLKDARATDDLLDDELDYDDFDMEDDDEAPDFDTLLEEARILGHEMETKEPEEYFDDTVEEEKPDLPRLETPPPTEVSKEPIAKFSPGSDEDIKDVETRSEISTATSTCRKVPSQNWRLESRHQDPAMPKLMFNGSTEVRTELAEIMKDPQKNLIANRKKYGLDNFRYAPARQRINAPRSSGPPCLQLLKKSADKIFHDRHHQSHSRPKPYDHRPYDLRDKLPERQMVRPTYPNVGVQNQMNQFLQFMPLLQNPAVVEGINQAFGPKYDMVVQRKIAEIQKRQFEYHCNPLAPVTRDGEGIPDLEFTIKGTESTMNLRFS